MANVSPSQLAVPITVWSREAALPALMPYLSLPGPVVPPHGEVARRHRRPVRIQILILIRVDVGAVVAEADAQRQRSAVVDGATLVPASAILADDEGGTIVKVVDDKNIAHDRPVQVGAREPEMVQVTGVEPGER